LFAQNASTLTNGTGDPSASHTLRTRLDFRPATYGVETAAGREFASVASAASIVTETATVGANPNPRCTSTNLTPLATAGSSYREIGLVFRGSDRKLYNAITFWNN
jgi:hypothetical protein